MVTYLHSVTLYTSLNVITVRVLITPCCLSVLTHQATTFFGHTLPLVSCLYVPPAVYSVVVRGEEMETTQWLVTLTFRVTVSGVRSKDDSVDAGLEQLKTGLCSGKDLPVEASVRRITNIVEEEPVFGVKW